MKKPLLRVPVLFSLFAVLSVTLFGASENFIVKGLFGTLFFVLAFFALAAFVDYAYSRYVDNTRILQKAKVETETTRLAEIMRDMAPDNLKAFMVYKPASFMEIINGEARRYLKTPWGDVPYSFIRKMLSKGGTRAGDYLYPVDGRDWTTSDDRAYAEWVTRVICTNRFATWWGPNRPARWIDDGCARFCQEIELDIQLPEPEEEPENEVVEPV